MKSKIFLLRVSLKSGLFGKVPGDVYREIAVPATENLEFLSETITSAFNFDMITEFGFHNGKDFYNKGATKFYIRAKLPKDKNGSGDEEYLSIKRVKISDVFEKKGVLRYWAEPNFEWDFEIKCLDVDFGLIDFEGDRIHCLPYVLKVSGYAPSQRQMLPCTGLVIKEKYFDL